MVPDHHDSNAIHPYLKKNMVGKFLEVAASVTRWIEMLLLWVCEDLVYLLVQLRPETIRQFCRDLGVSEFDFSRLFCGERMKNLIHATISVTAGTAEFLTSQTTDFAGIQLFGAANGFLVIHPVMHLVQRTQ